MNIVRVPQPAARLGFVLIFLCLHGLISGQTPKVSADSWANGVPGSVAAGKHGTIALPVLAPSAFTKFVPTNGASGPSVGLNLVWNESPNATSYEYCYDTTNDNACPGWTNNGTSTVKELSGLSRNTTYYWHVRAINAGGTTYSDGSATAFWSFTTGSAPGAFSKSSPVNGATNQAGWLTLSWGASSGAASYEYCYDTTNDDACSAWVSIGTSTSAQPSGLEPVTTYYWQVRAKNGIVTTYADESGTAYWSFTTEFWANNDDFDFPTTFINLPLILTRSVAEYTTAGDDPTLPCSGGQEFLTAWFQYIPTQDELLTFDTDGSTYDTVLAVWTGTRGNLTSVGCDDDGGSSFTSLLSVNATAGTTYYIEVASYFASPAGTGLTLHAHTNIAPPRDFAKTSPGNAAEDQSANLALSWEASLGATSYEYCYDTTNDSACSSWFSTGASTSANISGLTPGATYYWQVRANNSHGTTYADTACCGGGPTYRSFSVTTGNILWMGETGLGYPVSFYVSPEAMNWDKFRLNTVFEIEIPSCFHGSLWPVHITVPGPGSIVNNQFAVVSDSGFSAAGQLTSPATATGIYSFHQYQIVIPSQFPPIVCVYDFSESGTWTAGIAITISGNAGVTGATIGYSVDGTLKTVTAASNGDYSIRVPPGWSGTVTPALGSVNFTPTSRSYSNVISDQTVQNYTPSVRLWGNTGAAGAILKYVDGTPRSVVSSADGSYEISVPYNWSGTVTPSLDGVIFSPTDRSYTNLTSGQGRQSYKAAVTLSGNTSVSGVALSYVDRSTRMATSDGSGSYSMTVPWGWSGTVTPALASEAFCPASQTYNNVTISKAFQHYARAICPNLGSIHRWTSSFDLAHGWTVSDFVRTVGDVNGDGNADLVGFGLDGVYVGLSNGSSFATPIRRTSAFDLSHGWTVQDFVRTVGDVNADGRADLIGFGLDGVYAATSTGSGFNAISKWTSAFDLSHGWTVQDFVRTVGDVNGDGRADLIGFGLDGVYVSLSTGSSFPAPTKWTSSFDLSHGWTVSQFVRTVGDVNGDGKDDLVGFGLDGVYVATSTGSGFNTVRKWTSAFDLSHGWTVSDHVRTVGDVNGDGKDDLIGFGLDGVYVSLSMGTSFSLPSRRTSSFDLSHGWTVSQYVRTVGSVNGDGRNDLVGFGLDGVYIATTQ